MPHYTVKNNHSKKYKNYNFYKVEHQYQNVLFHCYCTISLDQWACESEWKLTLLMTSKLVSGAFLCCNQITAGRQLYSLTLLLASSTKHIELDLVNYCNMIEHCAIHDKDPVFVCSECTHPSFHSLHHCFYCLKGATLSLISTSAMMYKFRHKAVVLKQTAVAENLKCSGPKCQLYTYAKASHFPSSPL